MYSLLFKTSNTLEKYQAILTISKSTRLYLAKKCKVIEYVRLLLKMMKTSSRTRDVVFHFSKLKGIGGGLVAHDLLQGEFVLQVSIFLVLICSIHRSFGV